MKFVEKLSKLLEGMNKAAIARATDGLLSTTAINDYLRKGYIPRADKAMALSRALKVPLEWLLNDEAEWPPADPLQKPLKSVSDQVLMDEICDRHRRILREFISILSVAESRDWTKIKEMDSWKPGSPIPAEVGGLLGTLALLEDVIDRLKQLDPWLASSLRHQDLEGPEVPPEGFSRGAIEARMAAITNKPGFNAAARLLNSERRRGWETGNFPYLVQRENGSVPFSAVFPPADPMVNKTQKRK